MKLLKTTKNKDIFESHDYIITIIKTDTDRDMVCEAKYNKFCIYFDIKYNCITRTFFAKYNLGFQLTPKDEKMWIDGVQNTVELLNELNENVDELFPPNCTYKGLKQG